MLWIHAEISQGQDPLAKLAKPLILFLLNKNIYLIKDVFFVKKKKTKKSFNTIKSGLGLNKGWIISI